MESRHLRILVESVGKFLLIDNDFSIIVEKSASDQLRQMCLSQLTASDGLAQMRKNILPLWKVDIFESW